MVISPKYLSALCLPNLRLDPSAVCNCAESCFSHMCGERSLNSRFCWWSLASVLSIQDLTSRTCWRDSMCSIVPKNNNNNIQLICELEKTTSLLLEIFKIKPLKWHNFFRNVKYKQLISVFCPGEDEEDESPELPENLEDLTNQTPSRFLYKQPALSLK